MNSNTNVFAKVFCRPADGIDVGGLSERQKCRLRRPGKPDGIIFEYLQNLADQMSRLFCACKTRKTGGLGLINGIAFHFAIHQPNGQRSAFSGRSCFRLAPGPHQDALPLREWRF